jgi:hypothetical protein
MTTQELEFSQVACHEWSRYQYVHDDRLDCWARGVKDGKQGTLKNDDGQRSRQARTGMMDILKLSMGYYLLSL